MNGRSIGAVFAGIIAGLIVSYLFGYVVEELYPPNFEELKALKETPWKIKEYLRDLPAGFHFMGIISGLLRLLVGLYLGSLIDKKNLMTPIVIAAFFLLLAILDPIAFPHPSWYSIVYIPSMILVSVGYIYMKRRA